MPHEQLGLSNDELLSTTRAVRKRLDFDRPVSEDVLRECMEVAVQAPTGSNAQGWQFVFVTDPRKKAKIGEIYRQAISIYRDMPVAIHKLHMDSSDNTLTDSQTRSASSADYLAENMGKVPALLIPCIAGRTDSPETSNIIAQTGTLGSIIPAAWNFMLAARARGMGSCWTTSHLHYEREIAEILNIPYHDITQVALIPVAYTLGSDFKPAPAQPADAIMRVDSW